MQSEKSMDKYFKKDFNEIYNRNFAQIKKNFENFIEHGAQGMHDIENYSSDYEDEDIFTNKNTMKLWINNEEVELPLDLLKIQDPKKIFSIKNFNTMFTVQEQENLMKLLPQDADKLPKDILADLFNGNNFFFSNPIESFFNKLKAGYLTRTYKKELNIQHKLNLISYYSTCEFIHSKLIKKAFLLDNVKPKKDITYLMKRNALIDLESILDDNDSSSDSCESVNDVKPENDIEELSECETVIESINEEILKMESIGDIDEDLIENRKIEAQKAIAVEAQKNKKPEPDPILSSISAPKITKTTKNINSRVKNTSKESVENYRMQERERYKYPTKAWIYTCQDGFKGIVAPVAKKITNTQNSKPREHFLLKAERPSYITILCLVRDAAARLPDGVGTRADICELLKESQYINENITDDKLSNIVSGALDRLHYEDDPCVKYDSEKKLWIYLHRDRSEDYPPWIDQTDSRCSKKKEYNIKYKTKKKLKVDEISFVKTEGDSQMSQ